MIFYKKNNF